MIDESSFSEPQTGSILAGLISLVGQDLLKILNIQLMTIGSNIHPRQNEHMIESA